MSAWDRVTRRDVLAAAGGALALGMTPRSFARGTHVPGVVVFAEHSAASRRFATELAQLGATPVALTSDLVRQWYMGLSETVARKDGGLAGLTSWSDYLVARGLAAEQRRHPRFEAQHRFGPHGAVHCLPATCGIAAAELQEEDWPERMARLLLELEPGAAVRADATRPIRGTRGASSAATHFSWLID